MTSKPRATVKPPQSNTKDLSARRADDESDFVAGSEVDDIDDWEQSEITHRKRSAEVQRETKALVKNLNELFDDNTGETKKYLRMVAASLPKRPKGKHDPEYDRRLLEIGTRVLRDGGKMKDVVLEVGLSGPYQTINGARVRLKRLRNERDELSKAIAKWLEGVGRQRSDALGTRQKSNK